MTISQRAAATHNNTGTGSPTVSTFTVTLPTFQPGDTITVDILGASGGTTLTTPAGWTQVVHDNNAGLGPLVARYLRIMQPGDGATVNFTGSGSAYSWVATPWIGVNNASPVDGNSAVTRTATTGAVTTGHAAAMLLPCWCNNTGFGILANPSGTTRLAYDLISAVTVPRGIDSEYEAAGAAGAYTGINMPDTNNTWIAAHMYALNAQAPPLAPTLTSPVNSSYQDLAAGFTFTWQYNPATSGVLQTQYALRRKIGAGAYEWWNAGTSAWQSTEVFNTTTSTQVAFAAAKWSNGVTYNWSVATKDANGTGPYSADFTVTGSTAPTATATGPASTVAGATPSVTWSEVLQTGATQTAYRVVIESGSVGAIPGSGTTVWDSGVTASTALAATVGIPLANNTSHRAFVQVTQTGGQTSAWATRDFTVTYNTPAKPTVVAVWDSTLARCALTVQGRDNLLTLNQSSLETDTSGWSATGNSSIARSTAQSLDGSASLAITTAAGGSAAFAEMTSPASLVPVTGGKVYTALASFRAAATPRAMTLTIRWWSSTSTQISIVDSQPVGDNTAGWVQAAVTAQAPANATYASLYVTVPAAAATNEVHYVDRIGLFPDPTGNLAANSDFENGTTGWAASGPYVNAGSSLAQDSTRAYTGRTSLAVTTTAAAQQEGATANALFTTVTGTAYTASVWVYSAASTSLDLCFGGTAGQDAQQPTFAVPAGTWTRLTATLTATAAYSCAVTVRRTTNAVSTFWVDAVKVEVGSVATTYVPPTYSNLLPNPSFDADLISWGAVGGSAPTVTRDTTRVAPGSIAASKLAWVTGSNGGNAGWSNSGVYYIAGQAYTASAYVYVPTGSTPVGLVVYGTGIPAGSRSPESSAFDTWQRLSVTFVPTASGFATLQIDINASLATAAAGAVAYVDAVQVELGRVANPYVDGRQGPGYSWDASQNRLSAAAASFEDGTVGGWGALGTGVSGANSSARALDGTKSMLGTIPTATPSGNGALRSPAITGLVVGQTYTMSVWLYIVGLGGATGLQFRWINAAQTAALANAPNITTVGAWTRAVITFTATETTAFLDVCNIGATTSSMTFHIDGAQFEQRNYATPYGNTSPTASNATSTYQQPWTVGGFAATGSYLIEVSEDGGSTWTTVRGAAAAQVDSAANQQFTVYDYERTPGAAAIFRAQVSDGSGATLVTSLKSQPTAAVTCTYTSSWLSLPGTPALNTPIDLYTDDSRSRAASQGVFAALGRTDEIVVNDVRRRQRGQHVVQCLTRTQRNAVQALIDAHIASGTPLLLRQVPDESGLGEAIYLAVIGDVAQARHVSFPTDVRRITLNWTEQLRPAVT